MVYSDISATKVLGAPPTCLRFFRGLDCNLAASDQCSTELDGARALLEHRHRGFRYSDPDEYGHLDHPVVLGIYELPP